MTFTDEQNKLLGERLPTSAIKQIKKGDRKADYISGFTAISNANRIWGFDGWDSETVHVQCVESSQQGNPNYENREQRQGYLVAYTAQVRVRVGAQVHEDYGYGEGIDYSNVGQAHESAIKEAVTDALKRALRHWGDQFGLSLYDKDRDRSEPAQAAPRARTAQPKRLTDLQVKRLFSIATPKGLTEERIKARIKEQYKLDHIHDLSPEQYEKVIAGIEAYQPKEAAHAE